jgi:low affinity Fe/Cu permease
MKLMQLFSHFAQRTSRAAGSPHAFLIALLIIIVWLITGPLFHFSDTWQLIINTGTTIVTFLMVFLIQHTQNRDSTAMHLKLDELIRAVHGAHNTLLNLEEMTQDDLDKMHNAYIKLAAAAQEELRQGALDTDSPDIELTQAEKEAEAAAQPTNRN